MNTKIIHYLQPRESLAKLAEDIFIPVKKGFSLTCFFVAGTGKKVLIDFLLQEKKFISNIFGSEFKKTLFVFVDPVDALDITNEAYLQLIEDSLILAIQNEKLKITNVKAPNPLFGIKAKLESIISQNWRVVFLLNNFEFTLKLTPSIYLNLESLISLDKTKIVYVFLTAVNMLSEAYLDRYLNFKYAMNRITYYYPMLDQKGVDYSLDEFSKELHISPTETVRQVLAKVCGGHIKLLKYSINILKEGEQNCISSAQKAEKCLLDNEQLKSICIDIWSFLTQQEREILISIAKTGKIPSALQSKANFVEKTNLIRLNKKNNYEFFGELFRKHVEQQIAQEKLVYNEKDHQIFFGLKSCGDKFTFQEFKLLSYFIQNEGKVVSRDEVGQILWGSNYVDKYSDYSIDKIISTMRKKLDTLGFPSQQLATLKRRGFSFTNP